MQRICAGERGGLADARAALAKRQMSRKSGHRRDRHELLGKLLAKSRCGLARNLRHVVAFLPNAQCLVFLRKKVAVGDGR